MDLSFEHSMLLDAKILDQWFFWSNEHIRNLLVLSDSNNQISLAVTKRLSS